MCKMVKSRTCTQGSYYNLLMCLFVIFQECIQRVQDLQSNGKLTGVIDDRGKFIYITMEELESVAKFIRQHGRVSITELAESSNRLINLNPDNSEIQKKLIVGDSLEVGEVAS